MQHSWVCLEIKEGAGTVAAAFGLAIAGWTVICWCRTCGVIHYERKPDGGTPWHTYLVPGGTGLEVEEEPQCAEVVRM